jgi:integrase
LLRHIISFPPISFHCLFGGDPVATLFKINKRAVDALAPGQKRYKQGFGGGLTVRVEPTGVKSFVLEYRPGAGGRGVAKQALRLGQYGQMTVDQAQKAALDALARIRLGEDPAADKRTQRAALTVAALIDQFLSGHASKLKPKSQVAYKDSLAKLKTAHGAIKAEALTRANVAAVHHTLASTPYAANRMLGSVSKMFAWAEAHGLVPDGHSNPARKITRYREIGRERFLSAAELARLGDALREAETVGLPYDVDETKPTTKYTRKPERRVVKFDPFVIAAIRLLALTGARLREILHAKWSQVDLDRGVLLLSDSKTGKKPIYLSAAAQAVLAGLPRLAGNPHIIPGAKEGAPRVGLDKPWWAVTRRARLADLRIHDLRHSFASVGAGRSLGLPIIGKLLGHSQPSTTARYAHLDIDPMRRAADAIGGEIAAAMNRSGGAPGPARGDVVRFGKR